MNIQQRTRWIKEQAYDLGFEFVGVAKAEKMKEAFVEAFWNEEKGCL